MKKKILAFFIIANMCLCVACNDHSVKGVDEVQEAQDDDVAIDGIRKIGSKIGENEIYIASENMYLHFYKNFTHKASFSIDCLSTTKIDVNKLGVKIGISTPYEVSVEEVEGEALDLYTYKLFAGYDNKLAKELKEKDEEQYKEYNEKYEEGFKKLKNGDIGELHHYVVNVSFQLNHKFGTEKFNDIKIEYNGKAFEKNIGEVVIDYCEENPKHEKSLYASSVTMSDIYLSKNTEGIMRLEGENMYQAEKSLEITNMYLMNRDTEIRKGSFSINSSDASCELNWEGECIKIDGDTQVGVNAEFFREDFKDKTYYQYSDYLVIEYREGNEKYKTGTELYFKTKLTGYQLYAYFLDDIELFEVEI